jgi:hypothetical protein
MKRLPTSAALLLLFVVVWLCINSQKNGPVADDSIVQQSDDVQRPRLRTSQVIDESISAPNKHEISQGKSSTPTPFPQTNNGIAITTEFVISLAMGKEDITFPLPDGRDARGTVETRHKTADGSPAGVSGRLNAPAKGTFHFRLQPVGSAAGPVIGAVVIEGAEIAFRVLPGPEQTSLLVARPTDQVICRNYMLPPQNADGPQEITAAYPTDIETPVYQNGIIPLQSRPGAEGVIYLDFDGEAGPQEGWGDFEAAAPSGMTPAKVMNIWARVSEDFAPFNLNVTTDLQVFLNAPETSRQRCIITPTKNAAPNAGGVAYMGSFGWSGDTPCWCFYSSSSKYAAEIISHEIGHTLGLYHDGRISAESYYLGHSSNLVGWAPIMGAGYDKNLTQWSKGEYNSANELQDDIAIIAANPGVGLLNDDAGDSHASASALEVLSNGSIKSEGNIGTPSDIDTFTFTTTGGTVALTISPVTNGQNLDVLAGIYDALGNPVISDNPDLALNATLSTTLAAGIYSIRVNGAGRGNSLADGYSNYGSLGHYTITGTITGAIVPDRFTTPENSPNLTNDGTLVVSTQLNVTGDATNNGILRLYGDAILNVTGTFTNHGVIDIINWNGTLPPSMINTGTILDRSAHRVLATATHSTKFSLSVPGFAGHLYQLESTGDLTGPWTPLGDFVAGTGDAENPPMLQFTPDLDGPRRFYRVAVTPAPVTPAP